jgi:hypothetical protein
VAASPHPGPSPPARCLAKLHAGPAPPSGAFWKPAVLGLDRVVATP